MSPGNAKDRLQQLLDASRFQGVVDPRQVDDLIVELLEAEGQASAPGAERFLKDFLQVLLTVPGVTDLEDPQRQALISERLASRMKLPVDLVGKIVRLVLAPQHRVRHGPEEVAAFSARFGPGAVGALEQEETVDLQGFARRHGSQDSLLLLDTLLKLLVRGSELQATDSAHLQAAASELGVDDRYLRLLLDRHDPAHSSGKLQFKLEGAEVRIGRSPANEVRLLDPQVAPFHARLVRVEGGWRVVDAGSGRPTVLSGEAVRSAPLPVGRHLGVGPYTLWLSEDGQTLHARGAEELSTLSVRHLRRRIKKGKKEISLLSDVSFSVYSGEVVALVGPSGSGKTTLINAISGIAPADSGEVKLNGVDFHRLLSLDRSIVGFVPQDDLVHPQLTVRESLLLAARLRFPPDVTRDELQATVDRVLEKLDIAHIATSQIGDVQQRGISGGQRKRVNLGQELLTSSTRILFLDEPTSGLDPRAAQDIVRLVRRLADEGRIVFLVTHDLTPAIISQVDHLLVLAPGGALAFFGPPADACRFFHVPSPDGLFNRFDDKTPDGWARAYREDPAYRKYVLTREYLARSGSLTFHEKEDDTPVASARRSFFKDLATQTRRYSLVKGRDRLGMIVMLAQPVLLAAVMLIAFPQPTAPAIFMLTLSSLWFGMSSSVRELIADRAIWRRERRVGARLVPYLGSKVLVLGLVVVLQCLLLTDILYPFLHLHEEGFGFATVFAVQSLTALSGMALGLLVSAAFTSSEAAVGMLPLTLVPQIVFSSIMVPIKEMGALARAITWAIPFRYAFEAAVKTGTSLQEFAPHRMERWERVSLNGHLFNLGFKTARADDMGLPFPVLCGALAGFVVLFLVAAAVVTRYRDRQVG